LLLFLLLLLLFSLLLLLLSWETERLERHGIRDFALWDQAAGAAAAICPTAAVGPVTPGCCRLRRVLCRHSLWQFRGPWFLPKWPDLISECRQAFFVHEEIPDVARPP